jgi:hypothetical protein
MSSSKLIVTSQMLTSPLVCLLLCAGGAGGAEGAAQPRAAGRVQVQVC